MSQKNTKRTQLLHAIMAAEDKKTLEHFLVDLLTPQELASLEERWQIVLLMLKEGLPQREIAKKLSVSVALVSRASRQLQFGTGGFEKVYKKLKKDA